MIKRIKVAKAYYGKHPYTACVGGTALVAAGLQNERELEVVARAGAITLTAVAGSTPALADGRRVDGRLDPLAVLRELVELLENAELVAPYARRGDWVAPTWQETYEKAKRVMAEGGA